MATKRKPAFRRNDWRQYARNLQTGANTVRYDSPCTVLRDCNRAARQRTYRMQTEYYDTDYEELAFEQLPLGTRLFRGFLAVCVLLPLALIMVMALGSQMAHAGGNKEILLSVPVWYALLGAVVWLFLGFCKPLVPYLLYVYVLGHELTHVLAVLCSFGKIHGFKVQQDGGYIQTDKNNLFIALSPYFLPLWAMIWGGIWACVYLFWNTVECQAILYGGLGFWLSFHLFWTAWVIPKDQPDLAGNGTLFSLMLVYVCNLVLLLGLLSLFGVLDFVQFGKDCLHHGIQLWDMCRATGALILELFS